MAKVKTACPGCGAMSMVDEAHLGKTGRCKRCGREFALSSEDGGSNPSAHRSLIATSCPNCRGRFEVDAKHVGRSAKCKKCATTFKIEPTRADAAASIPNKQAVPVGSSAGTAGAAPEENVPAQWNVGDVILDLYEVTGVLGEGGMGKVYKVHHRGWNMDLAVKCPKPDFFHTDRQKENFTSECETWIKLGLHLHIVSCHYVRTLGGIPRVFAECVEGGTLKDWITSGKLYEGGPEKALERILDIAIQFAWGLHYAHEHEEKLIHQDIKPANVMMTPDGIAKVTDFGLAKARAAAGEVTTGDKQQSILVSFGGMTPAYCSPEQADKEKLSRKTDIWSWGLSILEMFTGEVTWMSGVAAPQALESYLEAGAGDESIPKMPDALTGLLRQCFQRNPEDRPEEIGIAASRLKDTYRTVTGHECLRKQPESAELAADSLNNQGTSMVDLGRLDRAEMLFQKACQAHAEHLEATYNHGLLMWRSGRFTHEQLVKRLDDACRSRRDPSRGKYLLSLVHIERGDAESAVKVLEQAAEQATGNIEISRALQTARGGGRQWNYSVWTHKMPSDVKSVAISPDGRWGVCACAGAVQLWDLAEGTSPRTLEAPDVRSVAISEGGRWVVSGAGEFGEKRLCLWDLASGKCVYTAEAAEVGGVASVAISADGRWGLSGNVSFVGVEDQYLRYWDFETRRCVWMIKGHHFGCNSVAISARGHQGLSGSNDGTVRLWDLDGQKCVASLDAHDTTVTSVALSTDARYGLSGGGDGKVRLWDLLTAECLRTFEGHTHSVTSVAMSRDKNHGLSASNDGTIRVWNLATGKCLDTIHDCAGWNARVAISPDARWGLWGGASNTLSMWHLSPGPEAAFALAQPRDTKELSSQAEHFTTLLKETRRMLETGKLREALQAVNAAQQIPGYERSPEAVQLRVLMSRRCRCTGLRDTWQVWKFEDSTVHADSTAISGGRCRALVGWGLASDGTVRLFDAATGECLHIFTNVMADEVRPVYVGLHVAIDRAGDRGLWVSGRTIEFWDLSARKHLATLTGHTGWINCLVLDAEGHYGLSGSDDKTLRLWDLAAKRHLRTFKGHTNSVRSVTISPDRRFALSGSSDRTLRLWDLSRGICIRTCEGHASSITSVAISADGRYGLSGSKDKTLRLWDLNTGKSVYTLQGHTQAVSSVGFSQYGRYAVSASHDKTLRVWDLDTGECLKTVEGLVGPVTSVSLSPDAAWALSGSGGNDKGVRLWHLDWEYEFPGWADWDDGARPYLEHFLTLHMPLGEDGFTRTGTPQWTDDEFQRLITDLQYCGYGWLRPEGVRRQLESMTREWQGPPQLPGSPLVDDGDPGQLQEDVLLPTSSGEQSPQVNPALAPLYTVVDTMAVTADSSPTPQRPPSSPVTSPRLTPTVAAPPPRKPTTSPLKIVDLRSEEEQRIESDAQAGRSLGREVDRLVAKLMKIGRRSGFLSTNPGKSFDEKRRNIRARKIGERLNEIGGMNLMRAAYYRVAAALGSGPARELESAWGYIGDWLP